uniref:Cilia- and flagella-associated protein 157 n=2 Tax=Eptatretus burgeri TaxID=7764 RepID=A0A8C4Q594_EPTBU
MDQNREKALYLQWRSLESRLARYQRRCDELEVERERHDDECEQLRTDKKDMVAYLNKTLKEREAKLSDLSTQLSDVQTQYEEEQRKHCAQVSQLQNQLQQTTERLTTDNENLRGRLAMLSDFNDQREHILAHVATLEQNIEEQQQEHTNALHKVEVKAIIEKERLKKDTTSQVNSLMSEFREAHERQMAGTVKRSMKEHVVISAQLTRTAKMAAVVARENERLGASKRAMRLQLDLSENIKREMAHKTANQQRVLASLLERCKKQEKEQEAKLKRVDEIGKLEIHNAQLSNANEQFRLEVEGLRVKVQHLEMEQKELFGLFQDERSHVQKLQCYLASTVSAMQAGLKDPTAGHLLKETLKELEAKLDEAVVKELLVAVGPAASKLEAICPTPLGFTRYYPGNLGLVPETKHKTSHLPIGKLALNPRPGKPEDQLNLATNCSSGSPGSFPTLDHSSDVIDDVHDDPSRNGEAVEVSP